MASERSTSNTPVGNHAQQRVPNAQQLHTSSFPESSSKLMTKIPNILPHERVFPVQIGTELFKLSGASLSSDAPSYFSQYFLCQIRQAEANGTDPAAAIRTLYIDRDPATFRDISLHLQGYHVSPRDGTHFVRLFADAQFYSLPKLISQLHEESIFMSIGHREFQIPRDLFSDPGNSPNFFSLGFAFFFSHPGSHLFPGLDREGLIRPPSILPPSVPGRSAETFAELLHLLRGYPLHIRSDEHRASLLRDCRYFNFKGLEQRLIPHALSFNQTRRKHEIVLRLEDILKSGISVVSEPAPAFTAATAAAATTTDGDATPTTTAAVAPAAGWVNYARPYVDTTPAELVLEVGGENMRLHLHATGETGLRVEFFRDARTRVGKLFEVIASKLNLPPTTAPLGLLMASGGASSQPATPGNTPLSSEDWVKCVVDEDTAITLDGAAYNKGSRTSVVHQATGDGDEGHDEYGMPGSSSAFDDDDESPTISGLSLNAPRKRRRANNGGVGWVNGGMGGQQHAYWILKTGQWRLRIQSANNGRGGVECVLVAVKLDAMSSELARNEARGFLKG
ncbi:hypothetical protein N0V82_004140 [Gnomoniopsis sp. IMI 355080]|nr:hypothetical protein N0V82_004140 [Gnomoniopsis sp. IMI 355080]